jgi:uncharacterized protein (TIGR03435 family)
MRLQIRAAILALGIGVLQAQQVPPPAYKYEVVSIRPATPGEQNSGFSPGAQGGLKARNDTLMQLLTFAYGARDFQIIGVPGWARTERYEINLTPDRSETALPDNPSPAQIDGWLTRNRQRMQAVLLDRFGLVIHKETRESSIYALTVAKNGHMLAAPANPQQGASFNINRGQQIVARSSTMQMLADSLASLLGRHVLNATGLDGSYDFKLEFARDAATQNEAAAANDERPSIFTALIEQAGLKLEPKRGPVPVFVVDKVEKPTQN